MMSRRYYISLLTLLAALLLNSCYMNELADLGADHSEPIEVIIQASAELQDLADEGLVPGDITYRFFAKSTYAKSSYSKVPYGDENIVSITPGTYDVLCYTSDFYDIDGLTYPSQINGLEDFQISAITNSGLAEVTKGERYTQTIYAPDPMFYCMMEGVEIKANETVELNMIPGTYKYTIIFPAVNLEYISYGSVAVYGVKTSLNLYTGYYPTDIDGMQREADYMPITVDAANDCFYAEFYALGFNEYSDTEIELTVVSVSSTATVMAITAIEEFDSTITKELYATLRNMPTGGTVTYGETIDAKELFNYEGMGPTIEPWDDEELNFVF